MKYQTFNPHPELESLVSCYWTLEVPAEVPSAKTKNNPGRND
jgi:hypothetical protein